MLLNESRAEGLLSARDRVKNDNAVDADQLTMDVGEAMKEIEEPTIEDESMQLPKVFQESFLPS